MMREVMLNCSGSCTTPSGSQATPRGNWSGVLSSQGHELAYAGHDTGQHVTAERMQLRALTEGLGRLKKPCAVHVSIISTCVQQGVRALPTWRAAAFADTEHADLWRVLDEALQRHHLSFSPEPAAPERKVSKGMPTQLLLLGVTWDDLKRL